MRELAAARAWLTVFHLPAYAPELNPVEPVWSQLKRSLANLVKQDIDQLTALARTRLRRMQYRPGLLSGFLTGTRLDLRPLQRAHVSRPSAHAAEGALAEPPGPAARAAPQLTEDAADGEHRSHLCP
jgi:hypothetical protein